LRKKEADFSKEKALLAQKVELLELQLRDATERETKQKQMYDTMMAVWNSKAIDPKADLENPYLLEAKAEKQKLQE